MARGGVYKSDVQKARDVLLAQGKHPSVDLLRVALGNTGSKTTIHRHLKELEEEESQGFGDKPAVSEALQDLVGRLAGRLTDEAEAKIAEAQGRLDARLEERTKAVESAQQESAALRTQLERTETALQSEKAAHEAVQQALSERATEVAQLNERLAGLTTRLTDHEAHAHSLEQKHAHAREALEHFRTSTKEQRDQDQRRHEHQIQELQVALRQANETLNAKNHDLLHLNRENSQWMERHGRIEQELKNVKQAAEAQHQELDALRQTAIEHKALLKRWAEDARALESARLELSSAKADLKEQRERRERADAEGLRACVRSETLEQLFSQLKREGLTPLPEEHSVVAKGEPNTKSRKTAAPGQND